MKKNLELLSVIFTILFFSTSCNGQMLQPETDENSFSSMQESIAEPEPEWSELVETTITEIDVIETESETIPLNELTIPTGDENEIIQWKDPTLEKMIRKGLDKLDGDILALDVMDIENLLIIGDSFVFIDDPRFKGLSYDDIWNDILGEQTLMIDKDEWDNWKSGGIQILNDLVYFKELKVLKIIANRVQDFRVLRELNNLIELDLAGNQISDISALSELINLKILSLNGNHIQDINALETVKNLNNLDLRSNQIKEINSLSQLINLQIVYLNSNDIQNVDPLGSLINLQELDISENPRLPNSKSTRRAEIDISVFSQLINLTKLDLGASGVENIQALSNLNKLTHLSLSSATNASDLTSLSGLSNLQELQLNSVKVEDISWISELTNLEFLRIANCEVKDISPLSKLVNLRTLDLHTNPRLAKQHITDISALSGMTKLVYLRLEGNNVSDLSPLVGLINLEKADLWENPITDWTPVAHVPYVAGRGDSDMTQVP